ncbi:MAG: hypothetical protein M3046_03330 [Actinomycetota bacterium]|nr:hypothetical protein [Actinomycetota bacterium]
MARRLTRVFFVLGAAAVVLLAGTVVVLVREPGGRDAATHVRAGRSQAALPTNPPGCRGPGGSASPSVPGGKATSAAVPIPGTRAIDTHGYVPLDVVTVDGVTWVSLRDPNSDPNAPRGLLGRVDADSVGPVIPVVDGCTVGALAGAAGAVWVGTCDERGVTGATSGGGLVRVDGHSGAITGRAALPTRCVVDVVAGKGSVWAAGVAESGQPELLARVDPATATVTASQQLTKATLAGLALTDQGLWAQELGGTTQVVHFDDAGNQLAAVPSKEETLVGTSGGALWFKLTDGSAVVERDSANGNVIATTPLAHIQSASAGPSGVWVQQATTGSLTVTVTRVDAASGAADQSFQYQAPTLDRTGRPFVGSVVADEHGVWVVYQGRLSHYDLAT